MGEPPTETGVPRTVRVVVLISARDFVEGIVTRRVWLSGVRDRPWGLPGNGMVVTTVRWAVSTTRTASAPVSAA